MKRLHQYYTKLILNLVSPTVERNIILISLSIEDHRFVVTDIGSKV